MHGVALEGKDFLFCPFEKKEFRKENGRFHFKGYASTFGNIDRGQDRVLPGAFKETIADFEMRGHFVPLLWAHDHNYPIGQIDKMYEDDKGLFVEAHMVEDVDIVKGRAAPLVEKNILKSMSIGYRAEEYKWVDDNVRNLIRISLFEISLVPVPMNILATMTKTNGELAKYKISFDDAPYLSPAQTEKILLDVATRPVAKKLASMLHHIARDAGDEKAVPSEKEAKTTRPEDDPLIKALAGLSQFQT